MSPKERTAWVHRVASRIRCPLLVVHGGLDTITPLENATRLVQEAAGPVETLIWPDSGHCCHDRSHIVRPAMADFMFAFRRSGILGRRENRATNAKDIGRGRARPRLAATGLGFDF